jgi:VRR-NUC domain
MKARKRKPAAEADRLPKWLCLAAETTREDSRTLLDFQALADRRPRDGNAEARIQASIVEWARLVAPNTLIFAIPNGGLRSKAEAARMKWTGTLAGVPDLAIVAAGRRVFFIEVKAPGGTLSADQRAIRDWLIALGSPPAICMSIDDARKAFAAWGIATSEARS